MSQNEMIIDYIVKHGSITPKDAVNELDIWRLASRITDLKRKGMKIKTTYVPFTKRDGKKSHYARYELEY